MLKETFVSTVAEIRYTPYRYFKRAYFELHCLGDPSFDIEEQRILWITGYASLAEMNNAMNPASPTIALSARHKLAKLFVSGIDFDACSSPLDPIVFDEQTYVLPSPFVLASPVTHHFDVYGFYATNGEGNLSISCNVGIDAPGLLKPSSPEASCICDMLTDDSDDGWAGQLGMEEQAWLSLNKVPMNLVRDIEFADRFRYRLRDRIEQILWIGGNPELVATAEENFWISVLGEQTIGLGTQGKSTKMRIRPDD